VWVWLGAGATIQSFSISYVLGFLMAVGVTPYSIGNQGWWDTFDLLPSWFKFVLCWAAFDYFFEITLVRVLLHFRVDDLTAVFIALVFAALGSLILTERLNRKKMNK
jgi:hypothetical protein